ncbi:MAG TPA: sporulation histidine kinase inhibitor Sda [Bacillales bacterium]|nr:sporulation histidine kinase inhibitor Sda [Bacillales bacterium]
MEKLSDRLLMEAYFKAIELELAHDFVQLIQREMNRRAIKTDFQYS